MGGTRDAAYAAAAAAPAEALPAAAEARCTDAVGPSTIHSCWSASSGVKRSRGSQRRHPETKLRNTGSEQRRAVAMSLVAGRRRLPLELGTMRGWLALSKNMRLRVAPSSIPRGGTPSTSIMHASWSTSFSPGNSG